MTTPGNKFRIGRWRVGEEIPVTAAGRENIEGEYNHADTILQHSHRFQMARGGDPAARATLATVVRRACVVVPPITDFYLTPHRFSALGARIAAEILRRAGWEVTLLVFPMMENFARGKPVSLPPWLGHLEEVLLPDERGPLSFFTRFKRFGPPADLCADLILAESPGVVFLSLFAFAYADDAKQLAATLKRRSPGLHVVIGGAGATVAPWYFREEAGGVDEIIAGEAESALLEWTGATRESGESPRLEIALAVQSRYRGSSAVSRSMKIGSAAAGARNAGRIAVTTMLSRGCPKQCAFCANHLCHGREFRLVPPDQVLAAFEQVPAGSEITVNFEDDNILFVRSYFLEILGRLKHRYGTPRFSAENGLDYTLLDVATVRSLVDLGFVQFNLSLGSADPELLERNRRPHQINRLRETLQEISRMGRPAVTYFICGLPGDTPRSVVESLLLISGLPTRSGISLFYPVPGLPGFEDPALFGSVPAGLCAGSSAFPWTGALTTSQMVTAFRLSRLLNLRHDATNGRIPRAVPENELLEAVRTEKRLLTVESGADGLRTVAPPGIDRDMEKLFFDGAGDLFNLSSGN